MRTKTVMRGILPLVLLVTSEGVHAQSTGNFLRTLKPYATVGYEYDSNLFRLAGSEEALIRIGQTDTEDQMFSVGAGVNGEFALSRQTLIVRADVFSNTYDEFSLNDFNGQFANLELIWQLGERLDGKVGYRYDRNLRDYANQAIPVKDLRTRDDVYAIADYRLTRTLHAIVRGQYSTIDFSEAPLLLQDKLIAGVEVSYVSRLDNKIGIDIEYTEGTFDNPPERDFEEVSAGPSVDWQIGNRTRVRGKAAYTSRTHKNAIFRDFDGFTSRFALLWNSDASTNVTAELYRELSSLSDEVANYVLVQGFRIEPNWSLTDKITVRLQGYYESRDFKGLEATAAPGTPLREDDVYGGSLAVDWQIRRLWRISAAIRQEDRTSNRTFEDYDFQNISLAVRFGY